MDLDIAVKTSLHLERPAPDECIKSLDELNELALTPLMLKKQPDIVTTIRFVVVCYGLISVISRFYKDCNNLRITTLGHDPVSSGPP